MTPGDPQERLADYRAKRDFAVTSEPSGTDPPPEAGHRFVVQRHRARRLHYDFRLEIDGVLVSWAVPKGPTLDPDARRLAVHVEDHPLDYFDFEGVIPAGEYGGGDVIVWDWGTWALAEGDDALAAVDAGDLHVDLTARSWPAASSSSAAAAGDKEQWLLLHKHDDDAVAGWDPEDHPRSVKSGRTNDEVRARPDATWTRHGDQPTWDRADRRRAGRPRRPRRERRLGAPAATRCTSPTSTRCCSRVATTRHAADQARPDPPPRPRRARTCCPTWPTGRSTSTATRTASAPGGFWHKAVPDHAPDWLARWAQRRRRSRARPSAYLVADHPAALAWLANYGAVELHPWTSPTDAPDRPTWALIDLDPGTDTTFDDLLVLARLHRTALEHLGVAATPKVTGKRGIQIWVPVGRRLHLRRDPGLGRGAVAGGRRDGARARELGVEEGGPRRAGPARLHAERHQQDPGRAVQPPPGARRAGVGADHLGRARRPRPRAPTGGRSAPSSTGSPTSATRCAR